jgi:amino acid adenylation domain-containing protein
LFERQVDVALERVAVIHEAGSLTYAELDGRANALARGLIQLGIGRGEIVPILVNRSAEAIVAILGVLKTGAGYAPIEFSEPAARAKGMMESIKARCVVTCYRDGQPDGHWAGDAARGSQIIAVPVPWDLAERPSVSVSFHDLFALMFTSGTTGTPKRVMVEHAQIVHYLHAMSAELRIEGCSFASVSSIASDLGNTAIFGALCFGGALLMPAAQHLLDPAALGEFFGRHRPDCLKIVPSHLAALLDARPASELLPGRCLILGGEALTGALLDGIRQLSPDCRIVNHYGPTECAVGALVNDAAVPDPHSATVPIGGPLANVHVQVLGENLLGVPELIAGELYIGGEQVTRGYLNNAIDTAQSFLPDPASEIPGARMYRTGDRARILPNGAVEFLGRSDRQIKISGFRVEPGEIEAVLRQHPAVRHAVVAAAGSGNSPRSVRAYVVLDNSSCDVEALQRFASKRLPAHMVPSAFVVIPKIPITANGKVDYRALESCVGPGERGHVLPATAMEKRVAQIWCAVLGRKDVSVDRSFFDLGGHSLMLIRLCAELQRQIGVTVPILEVFRYPTVRELSNFLSGIEFGEQLRSVQQRAEAKKRAIGERRRRCGAV